MKRDLLFALAFFFTALLTRLIFLFGSSDRDWPHSIWYEGDAPTWVRWAAALRAGEPFEFDLPLRTPGMAYLLHWLSFGAEPSFLAWKIVWCILSAATCAVMYLACRRAFSERISLIAAGLCVFSFGQYMLATSLNNETPYMFLLVCIVWLTPRIYRREDESRSLASVAALPALLGLLHGLAMLLRAEHALMLLMMTAYTAFARPGAAAVSSGGPLLQRSRFRAAPLMPALGVLVLALLVCLPWSIRGAGAIHRFNTETTLQPDYDRLVVRWTPEARAAIDALPAFARDGNVRYITYLAQQSASTHGRREVTRADVDAFFSDQFDGYVPQPLRRAVLVSNKAGLDFALANHLDDRNPGGFTRAPLGGDDVELSFGNPAHLRLMNHGFSMGFREIIRDPPRWFELVTRKLKNFSDGPALGFTARNLPVGFEGVRRPVDLFTPRWVDSPWLLAWRVSVLALLTLGVVMGWRRRLGGLWLLVIAYKIIVTVFFYGYARQAVSILPAFFLFIAVGVEATAMFVRPRCSMLRRAFPRLPRFPRFPRIMRLLALVGLLVGLLSLEIFTARTPPEVVIHGRVTPAPQWGPGAFESFQRLDFTREE